MELRPVKIFTTSNVPRLKYIADIILQDILGLSWELITDKRKLGKYPVINYSSENIPGALKISPDTLLFEQGVVTREIKITEWKGLPVFFQTTLDSYLPFDIFAASFYLVTRYEEYLDFLPDEYGRFKASNSLAFKNGFLGIPVVDLWTKELAKVLVRKFQMLAFKRNEFKALLTVDTDEPFAYLGKSLIGNIGGFIHDITSKTGNASHRYGCLAKGEKDPFEVFDYITETIERNKTDAIFFFPVGDHSEYDKNPSWKNDEYRSLINRIADKFSFGLHLSFNASVSPSLARTELERLKIMLKKDILRNRFHFLRIVMPTSFRSIHAAGITEDYSMGYPDEQGFRAGISRPFCFYDVIEDQITTLRIIPFQVMDVTLSEYKKLKPVSAKEIILSLINETKKAGGLFVSIWHNTSLLNTPECREWREVFEFTLKNQIP
jgi:hypothetical protein